MKISIYSSAWSVRKMKFDVAGALNNWSKYADEIVVAVNRCPETEEEFLKFDNPKVKIIPTDIDFSEDPFAYGKVINSSLQATTGDLLIQQDLDERFRVNKDILPKLRQRLKDNLAQALFVPTVDLYGSKEEAIGVKEKWYIHLPGIHRGPVNFGIKENGRPDYNKTSTDEAIDKNGNLVSTLRMTNDLSYDGLKSYIERGMPISYHLGFLNLTDRLDRNKFWSDFWVKATGGDKNNHALTIEELVSRGRKLHGLPLWEE